MKLKFRDDGKAKRWPREHWHIALFLVETFPLQRLSSSSFTF